MISIPNKKPRMSNSAVPSIFTGVASSVKTKKSKSSPADLKRSLQQNLDELRHSMAVPEKLCSSSSSTTNHLLKNPEEFSKWLAKTGTTELKNLMISHKICLEAFSKVKSQGQPKVIQPKILSGDLGQQIASDRRTKDKQGHVTLPRNGSNSENEDDPQEACRYDNFHIDPSERLNFAQIYNDVHKCVNTQIPNSLVKQSFLQRKKSHNNRKSQIQHETSESNHTGSDHRHDVVSDIIKPTHLFKNIHSYEQDNNLSDERLMLPQSDFTSHDRGLSHSIHSGGDHCGNTKDKMQDNKKGNRHKGNLHYSGVSDVSEGIGRSKQKKQKTTHNTTESREVVVESSIKPVRVMLHDIMEFEDLTDQQKTESTPFQIYSKCNADQKALRDANAEIERLRSCLLQSKMTTEMLVKKQKEDERNYHANFYHMITKMASEKEECDRVKKELEKFTTKCSNIHENLKHLTAQIQKQTFSEHLYSRKLIAQPGQQELRQVRILEEQNSALMRKLLDVKWQNGNVTANSTVKTAGGNINNGIEVVKTSGGTINNSIEVIKMAGGTINNGIEVAETAGGFINNGIEVANIAEVGGMDTSDVQTMSVTMCINKETGKPYLAGVKFEEIQEDEDDIGHVDNDVEGRLSNADNKNNRDCEKTAEVTNQKKKVCPVCAYEVHPSKDQEAAFLSHFSQHVYYDIVNDLFKLLNSEKHITQNDGGDDSQAFKESDVQNLYKTDLVISRDFLYTCSICQFKFHFHRSLFKHRKDVHNKVQTVYNVTNKTLTTKTDVATSFVCEVCGAVHKAKQKLDNHLKLHRDPNAFSCEICHLSFLSKNLLKQHKKLHFRDQMSVPCESEQKSLCEICGLELRNSSHASSHRYTCRIRNSKRSLECMKCSLTFNKLSELLKHKKVHNTIACDKCGCMFSSYGHLKLHYYKKHFLQKKAPKQKTPAPSRTKCSICGKEIKHLSSHMLIHSSGEKPWECDICHLRFRRKDGLKFHYTIHTGEKPYPCRICGRQFRLSRNRNTHEKRHTGQGSGGAGESRGDKSSVETITEAGQNMVSKQNELTLLSASQRITNDSQHWMTGQQTQYFEMSPAEDIMIQTPQMSSIYAQSDQESFMPT